MAQKNIPEEFPQETGNNNQDKSPAASSRGSEKKQEPGGGKKGNPLLGAFHTPHETAPFSEIRTPHFLPAFKEAIRQGENEISEIAENPAPPTFENTIEALGRCARLLRRTEGIFFNLLHAEASDELQQVAQEVSPLLTRFENDITLNPGLFDRIQGVYARKEQQDLTPEQQTLLEHTYLDFVRQGANLRPEEKEKFREITTELSKLTLKFDEHVLKETNKYEKHITEKGRLSGLPESAVEAAAEKAKSKGKTGWVFDITMPGYLPVMKYSDDRELREELYMAYMSKGFKGDQLDNREIVRKIVNLRLQLARLLGYKNYAAYVLERRMAMNNKEVYRLLDDLFDASFGVAQKEKAEVEAFARETGFEGQIMPWDWSYFSEKLKIRTFKLDDEMVKPYFELNKVIDGVFGLATRLFGISFTPGNAIPVYHEEVLPYEVWDSDGKFLGVLYTDFHPRPGKQGGAWMNDFKGQWKENGKDSRPHIAIVMNFSRPAGTKPALLTFREVETFMHEFGHALHGMLSDATYPGLAGTNVFRDFVELPSQIMENWGVEKEFLDCFARHYETGKEIPQALVEKLKDSRNFLAGYQSVRQLSFGYLDMAWHTLEKPFQGDVKRFEEQAWKKTRLFPEIEEVCMSTQFGHLFAGGYAAGYYGYKWAEVLDADAFALFREKGLFNTAVAASFRKNILERGGTEHPLVLYKRFRGKEPSIEALLIRSGLK